MPTVIPSTVKPALGQSSLRLHSGEWAQYRETANKRFPGQTLVSFAATFPCLEKQVQGVRTGVQYVLPLRCPWDIGVEAPDRQLGHSVWNSLGWSSTTGNLENINERQSQGSEGRAEGPG